MPYSTRHAADFASTIEVVLHPRESSPIEQSPDAAWAIWGNLDDLKNQGICSGTRRAGIGVRHQVLRRLNVVGPIDQAPSSSSLPNDAILLVLPGIPLKGFVVELAAGLADCPSYSAINRKAGFGSYAKTDGHSNQAGKASC